MPAPPVPPIPASELSWEVSWEEDLTGKPIVCLRKGDYWVRTKGRIGGDKTILFERAYIEALRYDLSQAADDDERRAIENDLGRAIKDEQVSQALRREAVERAGTQ
jgi:streptomycin 6-kinase